MLAASWLCATAGRVHSVDDYGAVRNEQTGHAAEANQRAFRATAAALQPGDTFLVPQRSTYRVRGGLALSKLRDVTIQLQGSIDVDDDISAWPRDDDNGMLPFLWLTDGTNLTVTGGGTIDGHGLRWWDAAINGEVGGHNGRPHLLRISAVSGLLLERLTLLDSPRFHVAFDGSADVVIRYLNITVDRFAQRNLRASAHAKRIAALGAGWGTVATPVARRLARAERRHLVEVGDSWKDWLLDQLVKLLPSWALQPEDLNTDGIDPNGVRFHVHDCTITNDDDSIAVKPSNAGNGSLHPCTRDVLLENLTLTGFGASIGSVSPHADVGCVRNVTFRHILMPGTGKGIYIKSNPQCGREPDRHGNMVDKTAIIEGITYENITMHRPFWWAIWIGPQQQHEPHSALEGKCGLDYPFGHASCPTQGCVTFANITLRDVRIEQPALSPGVVLGNASNPMRNITFEDVRTTFGPGKADGRVPWGRAYRCEHAAVRSVGTTDPKPCA